IKQWGVDSARGREPRTKRAARDPSGRARRRSAAWPFLARPGEEDKPRPFLRSRSTSNQAGNADVDAFLSELTLQEANEQQSHDAEESMHADFLVGPMMHGPPATGFGIFHGAKAILQLVLPPVP